MIAKEFLSQAFMLDQRINSKLEQVTALRNLAAKATASYTTEKVNGPKTRSPMENAIVKIIDLENQIDAEIDELVDYKVEIFKLISSIKNQSYRMLLEIRYLDNRTWEEVSEIMGYDLRWIYRLHGRALKEADQQLIKNPPKIIVHCT